MEFRNSVTFKDIEYLVTIKAAADILTVTISHSKALSVWTGSFTSKQIENLTAKTGNTKSFTVFCKLLTAALQNKNPSLHLDFYSYQDLELIRKGDLKLGSSFKPSKKKYLIVSYVTDFEKVHYPLPVILQDGQDFEGDSGMQRGNESELQRLRQENMNLVKSLSSFKEEFLNYRERTERKIEDLLNTKLDLESEIQRMKEELDVIILQLEDEAKKRNNSNHPDTKMLKASLAKQIDENNYLKSELAKSKLAIENLKQEEAANRRMFEALSRNTKDEQDDEHMVPIASPQQTSFKFSSISRMEDDHSSHLSDLHSQISKVQSLIQKNKN
jgi:coiled-coil domain-containing protein 61